MSSPERKGKRAQVERAGVPEQFAGAYVRILEALCGEGDFRSSARKMLREVSQATSCEAVALRVNDRRDDYPYFVWSGFDDAFIERESKLCHIRADGRVAREEDGSAALEGMCGLVLRGRTDPGQPFFTGGGSFWTNSTTDLLASTTNEDRGTVTRNTCNIWGYESLALVSIRAGDEIVGLIQANSRERDRFDASLVEFLEKVGRRAGAAVESSWRREELARATRELEERRRGTEAMLAIGEMAATLAHEVKNPLAGMMLSATRLKKALRGQEKLESTAEHLCKAVGTLSETVLRITDSFRGPRLERTRVSVKDVLESALTAIAPTASAQGVRILREFGPDLPDTIADPDFLRRAFVNLLLNALEAMPSSGLLRVEARAPNENDIEVVISDTGPGIDPAEVDRLFRPFVSTKPGSTGLGLGIVRKIMELHSGSVTLRPGEEGGTEAVVRLPVASREADSS